MIPTVDVSQYQGQISFAAFPYEILIMKLSGGDNGLYTDAWAYYNYDQAKHKYGKSILQYHFAGGTDPVVEANYFYKVAQPLELYDVFALDWEIEHPDPVNWVLSFVNQFHSLCGVYPIIYMDIDKLNRFDWSPVLALCGLWIAAPSFTFNQDAPTNGHPYIIQQGATISVPGISNNVDSDAIWMTLDQFHAYGWQGNPPAPQPTSPATIAPQPVVIPTPTPTAVQSPQISQPAHPAVNSPSLTVEKIPVVLTKTTAPAVNTASSSNTTLPSHVSIKTKMSWLENIINILLKTLFFWRYK